MNAMTPAGRQPARHSKSVREVVPASSGEVAPAFRELAPTLAESPGGAMLDLIARAARDPSVDVVKLAALLDMQERVLARQAEAEFNAALIRLSADLPRVRKNATCDMGAKGSYKFARWEDMDAVLRPLMQREGFVFVFDMEERPAGGAVVTGELRHAGGHSRRASVPLPADVGPGRNSLQAMGSTMSYGKRYSAEMLLNIVREGDDDDGRAAVAGELLGRAKLAELHGLLADCSANPKAVAANERAFLARMGMPQLASLADVLAGDYPRLRNVLVTKKGVLLAKRAAVGGART